MPEGLEAKWPSRRGAERRRQVCGRPGFGTRNTRGARTAVRTPVSTRQRKHRTAVRTPVGRAQQSEHPWGTRNSRGLKRRSARAPHSRASAFAHRLSWMPGQTASISSRVVPDVVEQFVGGVGLDELAPLHDDDVVGDLADDCQVA